tara:strand:- start:2064 stop:2780 length:717 start_codon:yes stop_codon:yes gene_type:complete
MLTNNNSDVNAEDLVERPRYEYHVDGCAVRKCKWKSHDTNNEGALDLITQGGYGDFIDLFDRKPAYFRLCHKHSHQFARWLNNDAVLLTHDGHAHNGSEPGFWHGHIGWDQKTWTSYVTGFFYHWIKQGFRSAVSFVKGHFKSHKQWTRKDINDSSTPVVLSSFFFKLFFLTNAYKGKVNLLRHLYNAKKIKLAKSIYRDSTSLYSEIWTNSVTGKLSESERALIVDLGKAFTSLEEE